jgi:hypothetical protein
VSSIGRLGKGWSLSDALNVPKVQASAWPANRSAEPAVLASPPVSLICTQMA